MTSAELAVTIEDLPEEKIEELKAHGYTKFDSLVRTNPGRVILPPEYRRLAQSYYNFKFRSDDIVVMSYPRSGSNWLREILWAMTHLDQLHMADQLPINDRVFPLHFDLILPYKELECSHLMRRFSLECPEGEEEDGVVLQLAAKHRGSPRIIATVLPFCLYNPNLLDTCKVVHVIRNPKDVCYSSFNLYSSMGRYEGDLSEWVELFTGDGTIYGPYWEHLRQAWKHRDHHNLHIMFYEDMKADFMRELRTLNSFLKMNLTDDQLRQVVEHTKYENMKAREKKPTIHFVKEGSRFHGGGVGGWGSAASQELDARLDAWIAEESRDLEISFTYNLPLQA